jgi:hypothetical protein
MGAWHQDGLADWLSVEMWLRLWFWISEEAGKSASIVYLVTAHLYKTADTKFWSKQGLRWATDFTAGVRFSAGTKDFLFPQRPCWFWGLPKPPIRWIAGLLREGSKAALSHKPNAEVKNDGAILCYTSSRYGAYQLSAGRSLKSSKKLKKL